MTPKQSGFWMPPEWHPHTACWMAWPTHLETWEAIGLERARKAYAQVAEAIAKYEPVILLVDPNDLVTAQNLVSPDIQIKTCSLNDSWTRDTGPTFLINAVGELGGVDWIHNAWGGNYSDYHLDNQLAKVIIEQTKAHYFHAPLVMEGGSFHVNGEGVLLTTRECLLNSNRNPTLSQATIEDYLQNYLNIETIIWLNQGLVGDETDGHVDEIACFVGPQTILCLITFDKADPNYDRLHENLEILKHAKDAKGKHFQIVTVEQPPATYSNQERLTLSYINFYLANHGIVMPAFGYKEYDDKALALFRQLFPTYSISQIEVLDVFAGGGGIHCITQQQPAIKTNR